MQLIDGGIGMGKTMKDNKGLNKTNTDEAVSEKPASSVESTSAEANNAEADNSKAESKAEEPKNNSASSETPVVEKKDDNNLQKSSEAKPAAAVTPPKEHNKKSRPWIAVIALIIAILALVAGGYLYQQLQLVKADNAALNNTTTQISQDLAATSTSAKAQTSKNQSLSSDISTLKSALGTQQSSVDELQDRLTKTVKQISQLGTNSRKDWLLAESEYLLRLANQRILLEKSPTGALGLLRSADEILRETDDVSLYNVRKAISIDVAALEAVPKLDVDGTFLKLTALNERVDQLSLLPVSSSPELPKLLEQVNEETLTDSWKQGLSESFNSAMNKLGSLIIIQHRDEAIEPLLTHEQGYFIQQNLHLMIEQSQLALLQGHQQSYDASINKATDWIARYFREDDSSTQALLKGLNELKPVTVAPALPDISGSLRALKQYFADIQSREQ